MVRSKKNIEMVVMKRRRSEARSIGGGLRRSVDWISIEERRWRRRGLRRSQLHRGSVVDPSSLKNEKREVENEMVSLTVVYSILLITFIFSFLCFGTTNKIMSRGNFASLVKSTTHNSYHVW